MDLDAQAHSFWKSDSDAIGQHDRLYSGRPARDHEGSSQRWFEFSRNDTFLRYFKHRRHEMGIGVMYSFYTPGPGDYRTNPGIFRKNVIEDEESVLIFDTGFDRKRLLYFDDQVRRAEWPIFGLPLARRRHVFRITFRCARIDPPSDQSNLFISQSRIVLVSADRA